MPHKFQAICLRDDYIYKGSKTLLEPSFIQGKTYHFISENYSTTYLGLGSITSINERGKQVSMNEEHFNQYFLKL